MKTILASFLLFFLSLAFPVASVGEHQISTQKCQGWKMTVVPDTAQRREVKIKGVGGGTNVVEECSEMLDIENLADHSRKPLRFLAVFDPKTRFVAWTLGISTNESVQSDWLNSLFVVPDVGMIRANGTVSGIRLELFKTRLEDFAKWKITLLETLTATMAQDRIPSPYEEIHVRLSEILGRDFFSRSGEASVPPPVKVLSVTTSGTGLKLELQSGIRMDKAAIYLDSAYRVLRASRNDKQVPPEKLNGR